MALELPPELGTVLGLLGLDWPQVNEDEVARLADELGKLASAIDSVQMDADKALGTLKEVYHGASADRLAELWGTVSKYSQFVVEACGATSTALHAAALVVEGCKGATATQLVATQGELAATSATGPWSSAAVIAAGKQIVSGVLEEAVSALGQALAQPVGDLVETVAKDVTGSGSGPSNSPGFGVDLSGLASCAQELRSHADDLDSHGASFRKTVEDLDVGQPGDMFGKLVIAAAEQIATSVGVEVLKRLLGSFRGTADGMDQVARNITGNEESHAQQMQSMLAGQNSPSSPGPLSLAGGVSGVTSGSPHQAGLTTVDGPHSGLDHADVGAVRGGDFAGVAGLLMGRGATAGGAPGLPAPGLTAAEAGHADLTPQRPPAGPAGPRAVFAQHGSGQALPGGDPWSAAGHHGTEPGGLGRAPAAQPPGALHSVPYGQAGGGGNPGQGGTGQVREAAAQQRSALRSRQDAPSDDPVEVPAAPSRDDATADV
ncbi:hypothetical protein [Kitasatospora sp. MAP5-34]|uniref:WXG100-like domain-containing protein n=1 Tax=Kitasatospora sp. MAP5-34 TaxID=3035102 RepID=UPI0024754320|nr:hypothetical protein [Kitasatospora sp. MAP5-34]MDH6578542.1 hypothetical protein [Kitasatospora sp. MAP5-34]